jgi:hypothetical protein
MKARRNMPALLATSLLLYAVLELPASIRALGTFDPAQEQATAWNARMGAVIAALPPDVSEVGYITLKDLDPSLPGGELAEFYLTQYALAPVLVLPSSDHAWVVGNFGNALPRRQLQAILEQKFSADSYEDFGFGIYLIHGLGY